MSELCGETPSDLREVLEPRRALSQVPLEPAQRRLLVLRRAALGVEVDELQRILERRLGSSRAASSASQSARRWIARGKRTWAVG